MSEQNSSSQEKTEEASQQKLKKSKADGQVARSKDLATTISLLATLFVLKFSVVLYYETLQESFRLSYLNFQQSEVGLDDLQLIITHNLVLFIVLLLPLLVTPLLVVVLSLVPGGWVFAAKNFYPAFSKLNPLTGLARIVSAQSWSELLKSMLKIAVLLIVAWMLIIDAFPRLMALQRSDLLTAIGSALSLTFNMTLTLLLVFVLFAFIDIPLQKFFFLKKMRMTKQERKEEHKNQEGRPEVKARIKQLQRQLLQRQINRVIKNADVVIVNPQHFAVALKYDPKKAQAPFVLAKGVDETALYIRKMASASQLEIIEMPPLARAIYYSTQVNQQIPAPLYTAVAHVLTYILQLRAYRQGRRGKPQLASNLNIPDSMANRGLIMNLLQQLMPTFRSGRIGIPLIILSILAMIILPLPPQLLDILFTFNIAMAILVLLVSVSAKSPLDFSLFPTVILITTLLRLCLNVASTRVVLLEGHTGTGAAGKVIEAFGEVVIGGNFIVGLVVFVILMIVNFIVITKGGERISEVTARFTLDALPGKQMAIDADLNAGLISQEDAKKRRQEVAKEADFYGAMDGASKFVRGDAIAGILILLINLFGGFAIGMFVYDLSGGQAFQQYALLAIGDGLVAQIPALLLSTAAAIIVTRINESSEITSQVQRQLLASPSVLYTVAGILFILGVVPGMPHLAFISFAALIGFIAWRVSRAESPDEASSLEQVQAIGKAMEQERAQNLAWEDIPLVERLSISLGYKLVGLVNEAAGAPLAQRVRGVRQTLSETLGFLLPEVQIRDSLRLKASQYNIYINGERIDGAELHADRLMAIPSPELYGEIDGILGTDPAYRMPVVWILPADKSRALNLGYQVIDCASVVATHLNKVVRAHLPDIFKHDDVEHLMQRLAVQAPKLAESLKTQLSFTQQHRVYRQLLQEEVSLKDIVSIATALVEGSESTKDPVLLASDARYALRRTIISSIAGERNEVAVFVLENALENTLLSALSIAQQAGPISLDNIPVEPSLLNQLQNAMPVVKEKLRKEGHPPILTVIPQLRPLLARYARVFSPGLHVLSQNEIPEKIGVNILGTLG